MAVDTLHPANAGIIALLKNLCGRGLPDDEVSRSPDGFPQPNYSIGTHPDLVDRLWEEVTVALPEKCRWVVYRRPALAHEGVIFGFATGTLAYALRLPPRELSEALALGAKRQHHFNAGDGTLDLEDIGEDCVFGGWYADEVRWCLAAYHHAASLAHQ